MLSTWLASSAGPALIPDRLTVWRPASSRIVRLVKAARVGGSLTEVTVRTKEFVAARTPSLTIIAIREVPKRFVAEVMVTVRLLSDPPKTMLLRGTNVVLVEVLERMSEPAAVSGSPMVKGIAAVGTSSGVVWFEKLEMVGLPFTAKMALKPLVNPVALAVSCLFAPAASIWRLV